MIFGSNTPPMNKTLFFLLVLAAKLSAAQTTDETKAIMEPVTQLFAGMNQGDSAMVHGAFVSGASFYTVTNDKEGKPLLRKDELQRFLTAVGTPHEQKWSEPIWDAKIQKDGNLANVWTKYAFYLDKKLSHCGVDAFQLFKGVDGKWRIFYLADTRQREGCVIPKEVSNLFK
jgi:hypothetical protein